ncbi:MAG: rane protein [Paenibacillus sp.]|nr:rane protein [Paenibacillus sp.]
MSRWMVTIALLVGSAILNHWIPFSSFFRNLDTMVHEFGHAIATLLLSGKVLYIYLFADHSGVTYSYITGGWRVIPMAMAGYITASLFAVYLFYAYSRGRLTQGLVVCSVLAVLCLALFVRNGYGMAWIIGFLVVNGIVIILPFRWLKTFYYLLVAFVSLEESVVGPVGLAIMALNNPSKAGDASSLAQATGVPAPVWGIVFVVIALVCARSAIGYFMRKPGRRKVGNLSGARRFTAE